MNRGWWCVLVCLALDAQAFPISPRTLWELSKDSELIVVAKVGSAHSGIDAPTTYDEAKRVVTSLPTLPDLVRLEVERVLVGPKLQRLDVEVTRFICPAPPVFDEGKQVVAFLARSGAVWSVVGLSYGTLYPRAAELPVLEKRILEARALQASGTNAQKRLEWLVESAVEPVTRWHGLYPLGLEFDDLGMYDRHPSREFPPLSAAQLERLTQAFIRKPTTDSTLPMMMFALASVKNSSLDAAFIGAFETSLAHEDQSLWELESTLWLLLQRFTNRATVDDILPKRSATTEPSAARIEQSWRTARERLSLPNGSNVEPRERSVRGVEADTPL